MALSNLARVAVAAGALAGSVAFCGCAAADNVLTYHNSMTRHGAYTVPGLTLAAAANMHPDAGFKASVPGDVYAQPLFWHPSGGQALVIVETESNNVVALNAKSGKVVWQVTLGNPATSKDLPCGNISPDGITGTPIIDKPNGRLYLDALVKGTNGIRHMIYALSLADGSTVAGWPLDIQAALKTAGVTFSSLTQGERSALQMLNGDLYVNYGGNWGDCGSYRGTVVQIQTATPKLLASWQTRANGGGIWAQGGLASDGTSLYATTGNTFGASTWSDGEGIIRLSPGLKHSGDAKNYFTPGDWKGLDNRDQDLGGTEALPLGVAVPSSPNAARVIAFGKDGKAYLADRNNLGGVGGQLAKLAVSGSVIITAPAVYETSSTTMVAFTNFGTNGCSGNNVAMLKIAASGAAPIALAWCAGLNGAGAPIVTTTDGTNNPIIWVTGAEGDNLLHGFNALTGQVVYAGGTTSMSGLRHFGTIIAAEGHLYVAGDFAVYAFAFN